MIELGKYNTLKISRELDFGVYLVDDEENDVLLPKKYIPKGSKEGDVLKVFIYKDSEDRLIATTLTPKITLENFAVLKVRDVNKFGAFLDWGLEKDLLVPFIEQKVKMEEGKSYMVYLVLDEDTNRLVGSSRIDDFLEFDYITVKEGEEVEVLIWNKTDLGVNVIINGVHKGLVFNNEIFKPIKFGDVLTGYVKTVRPDKKIDVILQQQGYQNVEPNAQKILDVLKQSKGFLALTDKSNPEEIKDLLHMSKKTFKKAIGALYKDRIVRIETDGVYLIEPVEK